MRAISLYVLVLLSLLTLAACDSSGNTAPSPVSTPASQPTNATSPVVSVDCPAPGTARAAVLPPLSAGTDQNMVYLLNAGGAGSLQRYDVTTSVTSQITSLARTGGDAALSPDAEGTSPGGGGNQTSISDAALSPDGQWILFVGLTATQARLQLVRLDGRDLQTLYCATPASAGTLHSIQWSPNGHLVAFETFDPSAQTPHQVDVLNLLAGTVQPFFGAAVEYPAVGWLDNTRLYLRGPTVDGPSTALYLLDLGRGPQQVQNDLLTVFQASETNPCWDAASSADRTQVFVGRCTYANTGNAPGPGWDTLEGPGSLSVASATGGSLQTLYTNPTLGLAAVRAVTPSTLLVLVNNYAANGGADTSQNGLWKLSPTGSGFTRLAAQGKTQQDGLNAFTQDPWANGSRDGQFYALTVTDTATSSTSLVFGGLSGGPPASCATAPNGGSLPSLALVGWTAA